MVRLSRLIAAGALALSLQTCTMIPAMARTVCAQHQVLVGLLKKQYGEAQRGLGTTSDGMGLVELYVSPDNKFAIIITDQKMMACLLLAGDNWYGGGEDAPVTQDGGRNGTE